MAGQEILAVLAAAVTGGLRFIWSLEHLFRETGAKSMNSGEEKTAPENFPGGMGSAAARTFQNPLLYAGILLWTLLLAVPAFCLLRLSGAAAFMPTARLVDMAATYLLLSAVDIRIREVPDSVLLCFLCGQMLMGISYMDTIWLFHVLAGGILLFLVFLLLACFSGGRLGMGDVKLLGATAMAAGWGYTLQIFCLAFVPAFLYGLWLLLVRKKPGKTEVPFVPFLTIGMVLQIAWWG